MNYLKERDGDLFSNADLKRLIVPLLIEQLLAIAVGMADSIMVSSVGEAAVSSVSLIDTIFILLINMFTAIATGGAVVCGQYIGKKRPHKACEAADQLLLVTTALSVVIMAAVYLLKPFILHVVFGNITAEVERTPMKISIVMNLINISGNALLVYALKFGVDGVAIPTLLSRMYAAAAAFVLVHNKRYPVRCSYPVKLKPDFHMLKKILGIGIPNGLENSMFQLGKIMVLSMITQFGTASIAANAVSNTIAVFQTLPGMAIGNAVLTVSAQCAGAGDYEQVKYYAKKLHIIIYGMMIVCCLGVIAALPAVLHVYSLSAEATAMTEDIIVYHGICCMIIWPIAFNLPNVLRASNDVAFCMILSILSMWICRIGMSYVLGVRMGFGVFGVWVAMTMDWVVRAIFFVLRYRSGKWQHQT